MNLDIFWKERLKLIDEILELLIIEKKDFTIDNKINVIRKLARLERLPNTTDIVKNIKKYHDLNI